MGKKVNGNCLGKYLLNKRYSFIKLQSCWNGMSFNLCLADVAPKKASLCVCLARCRQKCGVAKRRKKV